MDLIGSIDLELKYKMQLLTQAINSKDGNALYALAKVLLAASTLKGLAQREMDHSTDEAYKQLINLKMTEVEKRKLF